MKQNTDLAMNMSIWMDVIAEMGKAQSLSALTACVLK